MGSIKLLRGGGRRQKTSSRWMHSQLICSVEFHLLHLFFLPSLYLNKIPSEMEVVLWHTRLIWLIWLYNYICIVWFWWTNGHSPYKVAIFAPKTSSSPKKRWEVFSNCRHRACLVLDPSAVDDPDWVQMSTTASRSTTRPGGQCNAFFFVQYFFLVRKPCGPVVVCSSKFANCIFTWGQLQC